MLKKILPLALFFYINANAAVFDYRIYYGNSVQNDDNVASYSASIYSYLDDSDFAVGVQGDYQPKLKISSAALLLGYDISRVHHIEINAGKSIWFKNGEYNKGYHYAGTYLVQSNFDNYLEALQVGASIKYDIFKKKKERQIQLFVGFGF